MHRAELDLAAIETGPAAILRHPEMPHLPQVGRIERQSGLDPQVHDVEQLLAVDRIEHVTNARDRAVRLREPAVLLDVALYLGFTFTGVGEDIHDPQVEQLLGREEPATEDHALRPGGIETAREEAVGAQSRGTC